MSRRRLSYETYLYTLLRKSHGTEAGFTEDGLNAIQTYLDNFLRRVIDEANWIRDTNKHATLRIKDIDFVIRARTSPALSELLFKTAKHSLKTFQTKTETS